MKENYELAYIDYKNGMKYKDIAEKYGVTLNTVKSWKTRKWGKGDDEKSVHTKTKSVRKKKSDEIEQSQRKNRGNPNPKNQFTERNQVASKHNLFSRYIPKETLELMGMLEEKSPADLIWDQITIQYAAIIRSQSIMFVESKGEMIKELKKFKPGEFGEEEEWNFQFAWERQAQFLNAQSRAISELRNSINHFLRLADEADERRLKLKQMQLNIDKTNAEIGTLNDLNKEKKVEIVIRRKEARD